MALTTTRLKRSFEFEVDGKELKLPDPNPRMTPDEVMSFYSNTYPELTTATVAGPEVKADKAVYEFKTTIGTKG
ncbi:MAG: PRTRC system protein C [Flavobacteriales bacterium]|nr:PRTRC system protein C [Flavobacteriales bacterium]